MHMKIIKTFFINTGAAPSSKLQVDDDEDVLSDFIVKQKQKTTATKPKAMSEKQKQMAAALGLEDEIEVDDLIDEIETIDQKEEEEEGDSSDSGSSFTGQSECMYTPSFASAKPTGRNKLPPLGANGGSLPPLRGVRKPPF